MTSYYVATALAVVLPASALARDEAAEDYAISANIGYFSDYRFRGVSLSDEDFALQGGIDVTHSSGFYVGTWGSSIEPFNGAEMELDLYGGYPPWP